MIINWLGHSCFKVETEHGSIVFDPYEDDYVPGYTNIRETADVVLCSHGHRDHNAAENVRATGLVPYGITVEEFRTYHDDLLGSKRGETFVRILDDGKTKIAHLGDIGCSLNDAQVEALSNLDVLMIPIGGYYTIDGAQAAEIVKQLEPRIVLPMHYKDRDGLFGFKEISTRSDFLFNFSVSDILVHDFSSLDTEKVAIDLKNPLIVLMTPSNIENK